MTRFPLTEVVTRTNFDEYAALFPEVMTAPSIKSRTTSATPHYSEIIGAYKIGELA
jgi:hypothetical protein